MRPGNYKSRDEPFRLALSELETMFTDYGRETRVLTTEKWCDEMRNKASKKTRQSRNKMKLDWFPPSDSDEL
jgi:hypothetical protein